MAKNKGVGKRTRKQKASTPAKSTTTAPFEYPKYDFTAVITNGGTTTPRIALGIMTMVGVFVPAAFTGVALTFKASPDGGVTWFPVTAEDGTTITLVVAAGKYVKVDPSYLCGVKDVQIVSGSAEGADRTLILATRPI